MTKRVINIDICQDRNKVTKIKGRLLGLINKEEFKGIIESQAMRTRLFCVETTSLEDVADVDDMNGLRLVVAVRKKNGKDMFGKHLFVSDPLTIASYLKEDKSEAHISSENNYFILQEEEA